MASPLSDLDELVLKCRDDKAKSYIREAVACYKSGAFRSAIVSTWIAVAFDIIDKYKELSLAGDKQAEAFVNALESARATNDIVASLKFERELLCNARDVFQLISHVECVDLERLQQDRNRCAHPSMTINSEIFNPPAELARVHIRSAVEYLLQHPPAQGKYALVLLLKEVDSGYFPVELERAVAAFTSGPLYKCRSTLAKSFIVVLLKKFFAGLATRKEELQISTALKAVEVLHKHTYDEVLSEKLSQMVREMEMLDFYKILSLLSALDDTWVMLDGDVQHKISSYVEEIPSERFDSLTSLLKIPDLKVHAEKRIGVATRSEVSTSKATTFSDALGARVAQIFADSGSFASANDFGDTVIRFASYLTKEQVLFLIRACGENDQIKFSFVVGPVLVALSKNPNIDTVEFNALLVELKLEEYTIAV